MECDQDWDIEKYRQPYEPVEHWKLKEEFMKCHKNKFPQERLICLAQAYVNITLLGCR